MPWIIIVVIVIAVFLFGEWKERKGEKRGDAAGYQRAMPRIAGEVKAALRERDLMWMAVVRGLPQPPIVLELGDGVEIRQKPVAEQK